MARFLVPKNPWIYNYGADALEGDPDKIAYEEPIPSALKHYQPLSGYGGGGRVLGTHVPTKLRFQGRKREIPDYSTQFHMLLINQRFLDVVERFQKQIQVFPVECTWSDGTAAGSYFFFFTTVLLDAVIRERTTATWIPAGETGLWDPQPGEVFTFDKARIGDNHIWLDTYMPGKWPLVSEELFSALKRADIRLFQDSQLFEEV